MNNKQNDEIFACSLEDFEILYVTSDTFAKSVNQVIARLCDDYTSTTQALRVVFQALWDFDCELLVRDKRKSVGNYLAVSDLNSQIGEIDG